MLRVSGAARALEGLRARGVPAAVFLHIPKTAGTSVWALLEQCGGRKYETVRAIDWDFPQRGIVTFNHVHYAKLVATGRISREFDETAFKFTVVRNPFDRAVSLFSHYRRHGEIPRQMTFEMFLELLSVAELDPIGLHNHVGLSSANPQVRWLEDVTGGSVDCALFRFEALHELEEEVQRRFDVDAELPKLNRSSGRDRDFRHHYSSESRAMVEHVYAEDLEAFGYEFSP